ncbi:MAG: fatty acid desaturase [Chlamydiota bacterium]|nr:fatty acid desaturase [Chlamydiota bacterium]
MKKLENFNWKSGIFLITYQIILFLTLPWYLYHYTPSIGLILTMILLLCCGGLSITAGYHRLFSHKCYKTSPIIECIALFFGSTTFQGSALRWSFDHRKHHAFVDTDKDPYSIKKGFWYAHFLWLLEKQEAINPKVVPDLMKNKRIMFQNKYDVTCMVGSNIILYFIVAWISGDYMGAFFITTWTRLFLQHHSTWFINSLAHTWGDKPFCQEHSAVNNFIISFLTFGEGYHNYHHTFANDYRNGVRWYQFDPTKWIIWGLSKVGLAWGLRRVDKHTIQKKIVLERKDLLLEQLTELWYVKKEELEQKIQELSDKLLSETSKFNELTEKYHSLRRSNEAKDVIVQLRHEIKSLKANLREDWRSWGELSATILKLKPIPNFA